jgi:hypothetical protein
VGGPSAFSRPNVADSPRATVSPAKAISTYRVCLMLSSRDLDASELNTVVRARGQLEKPDDVDALRLNLEVWLSLN